VQRIPLTRQIPSQEWKTYFERFTRDQLGDDIPVPKAATIELQSPTLGLQYEGQAMRLLGLTYDPKNETFEVLLEEVTHLVSRPVEIWVIEEDGGFVPTLALICPDGKRELVSLYRSGPLALRHV
jgi:hypothetical protein